MDEKSSLSLVTQQRTALATRLVQRLDEVLAEESPPAGIAAEILEILDREQEKDDASADDLYSMQAALTALTQETRLQSRAFTKLSDKLEVLQSGIDSKEEGRLPEELRDALHAMNAAIESLERQGRKGREDVDAQAVPRPIVALLVDMRERLLRAREVAEAARRSAEATMPTSWPIRWFVKKSMKFVLDSHDELLKGYAIAIERLEDELAKMEIVECGARGERFDPMFMKIVDIEDHGDVEDGTVLEIYRRGYTWREMLLYPAEVKVARRIDTGKAAEG